MDQSKLIVDFVKTRLMDEYNKRTGGGDSKNSNSTGAMFAGAKSKGIYLCKKPGHKKSQCFRNKQKKPEKQSGGSANQIGFPNLGRGNFGR